MLILLPAITFAALVLLLVRELSRGEPRPRLLPAVMIAWSLLGALTILATELLGVFHLIGKGGITAVWAALALLTTAALVLRGVKLPSIQFNLSGWKDRTAAGITATGLLLIAGATLVIALNATPNTIDSLLYHLPRMHHWIQNGTLQHYATSYTPQLYMPIYPEVSILHLFLLTGQIQSSNLMQWVSMLISLVAVAAIVDLLGGTWKSQAIAVLFAAAIPMGILQASSTQTDYVATVWLLATAYFVTLGAGRSLTRLELIAMGCAIGAGALSKHTFYPYALPFLIWYAITYLRKRGFLPALKHGLILTSIFLIITTGYFSRNITTFGRLFAPSTFLESAAVLSLNPLQWIVNSVDHIFLNFITPFEGFNAWIERGLTAFRALLRVEDGSYLRIWSWNHEDLAGNPLHFIAVLASTLIIAVNSSLRSQRKLRAYLVAVIASFLVFGAVIDVFPYAARHHITFLAAFAPLFGIAFNPLEERTSGIVPTLITLVLVLTSIPWLFLNRSRPLIGMKPTTMSDSILEEPAFVVLFANRTDLREPYREAAQILIESGCRDVGLEIDSHDYEFPLWWFFDEAGITARIEAINAEGALESYEDPSFEPCAIFSTLPADLERHSGYRLLATFSPYSVYVTE